MLEMLFICLCSVIAVSDIFLGILIFLEVLSIYVFEREPEEKRTIEEKPNELAFLAGGYLSLSFLSPPDYFLIGILGNLIEILENLSPAIFLLCFFLFLKSICKKAPQ
ncbi:MAG: hypothetical protein WC435_00905 [Candidatus Paceibacterota bacterium]